MKYILLLLLIFAFNIKAEEFKINNVDELKPILKQIKPGDVIVLSNGEWKDARLLFSCEGNKEKPITIKAETPGKVILTGSSSLKISGDYLVVDGLYFKDGVIDKGAVIEFRNGSKKESNYSRLTNCVIEDYNHPDKTVDYKWVSVYGTNNRVDHCYFRNKSGQGCLLVVWLSDKPNYHLIDSNYFAYRPELGNNGAEIIRIGTSDWSMSPSHSIVENNYFEQCNGEREIISNKSGYNIYRYNTFVECQGALTLRHGNNCDVYGNFFFGNNVENTGGVRIIGEGHKVYNNYFQDLQGKDSFSALSFMNGVQNSPLNRYYQVKNAVVTFNTFVNNKNSIEIGVGKDEELSLPPINSTIAFNVVYSIKGKLIKFIDNPQNFIWKDNMFYGSELGVDINYGITIKDPEFHLLEGLYRPEYDKLLKVNIDNSMNYIHEDIDGQKRCELKYIGCDEPNSALSKNRIMSKDNTGPNWKKK